MIPVAYLFCPGCYEVRRYVLYDEPFDENLSQCCECGHCFGYGVETSAIVGPNGVQVTAKPKPVLDPAVLRDGMLALRAEEMAVLTARYGCREAVAAQRQLASGLGEMDWQTRVRMLNAVLPPRQPR